MTAILRSPLWILTVAIIIASATAAFALSFSIGGAGTLDCDITGESFAVKVIYCVKSAVFLTTQIFLPEISALMMPVTFAVGLLTLVILGVRVATGERDPQKMAISFLLKFGIVLLLADNFGAAMNGGLTDDVFSMTEQLQAFTINAVYNSGICAVTGSGPADGTGYILAITYTPWEHIDCIFEYIFGFGVDATIASSLFGIIGSAFFGGTMGAMLFFLGIAVVLSLLFFAFRAVYIVLVSYIYIGFLIAISPLFIPLLMFKVTERAFYKWLFNMIGGMAQPFFMVAYLGFIMPILDTFVFDDSSPQALTQTLGRADDITSKYRLAAPACEMRTPADFDFYTHAEGSGGLDMQHTLENILNPLDSGAMDWCGMFEFSKVDYGEEHTQELWEIGMSLIRIMGVCILMLMVAKKIPELVGFMIGGYSLGVTVNNPMLFESAMKGGFRSQMQSFSPGGAGYKANNSLPSMLGFR